MKFQFLLVCVLLLSACSPFAPHVMDHGGMPNHNPAVMRATEALSVTDVSGEKEIAFRIRSGDQPFTDYGISHTKKLHLVVVRSDLTHFEHLHPTLGDDGVWRSAFTPEAGGDYWLYADFVDTHNHSYVLRFRRTFPGETGTVGLTKDSRFSKTVDGYTITLSSSASADGMGFRYDITDAAGAPVALEPYLGARGHSVLITPEGDYEHAHDVTGQYIGGRKDTDPLDFLVPAAPASFYRMFTQFQIKGHVITVDFDWERPS